MNHIAINGVDLAYIQQGQGPALLLVHGNSLSHRIWNEVVPVLASQYQVIAVDLPGHGASAPVNNPEEVYHIPGMGRVIAGFLEALSLRDVTAVGHSMGGHILYAALRHTSSITQLITLGAPPCAGLADMGAAFHALPEMGYTFKGSLTPEEALAFANAMAAPASPLAPALAEDILATDVRLRHQHGLAVTTGMVQNEHEGLALLKGNAILATGEADRLVNAEYYETLTQRIDLPQVITAVIPGRGHIDVIAALPALLGLKDPVEG